MTVWDVRLAAEGARLIDYFSADGSIVAVTLGYGLGTLILTLALIWGIVSYQRRNRANEPVTEEATRELYQHPDRYERQTHDELQKKLRP